MRRLTRSGATTVTDVPWGEVEKAVEKAGFGYLINDKRFRHVGWMNHSGYGMQGAYGYQVVGTGVSEPIIYAAELHRFIDDDKRRGDVERSVCIVVVFEVKIQWEGDKVVGHEVEYTKSMVDKFFGDPVQIAGKLDGFYKPSKAKTPMFLGFDNAEAAALAAKDSVGGKDGIKFEQ